MWATLSDDQERERLAFGTLDRAELPKYCSSRTPSRNSKSRIHLHEHRATADEENIMADAMAEFNKNVIDEFRKNGGKVGGPFARAPMVLWFF